MWNFFKRNRDSRITTQDLGPYSNYRMAVRLELTQRTGVFAQLANAMAEENASLGAVDMVSATRSKVIRDVTVDVQSEEHGERVLKRLNKLPDVRVIASSDRIFLMHLGGKISVESKFPITTRNTLSMVYTPGVGRVVKAIAKDEKHAYTFTASRSKSRLTVKDSGNTSKEDALHKSNANPNTQNMMQNVVSTGENWSFP